MSYCAEKKPLKHIFLNLVLALRIHDIKSDDEKGSQIYLFLAFSIEDLCDLLRFVFVLLTQSQRIYSPENPQFIF